MKRSRTVFRELRFRPYRVPSDEGNEGEWASRLNRALMEVQVWALLDHSAFGFADAQAFDAALRGNRQEIVDYARRLHIYNERFNDTIQRGTTGRPNVEFRYDRYRSMVAAALADVPDERRRRFFSLQQKQNIWDALADADRVCSECGQALSFAEAEVDHIRPFSEGGETVVRNGALIHPLCNRAKGARWDPTEDGALQP